MKIDGRKATNAVALDNGYTLEISKYHGMFTIKVINADRLVVAEFASLVSKHDAQTIAGEYINNLSP